MNKVIAFWDINRAVEPKVLKKISEQTQHKVYIFGTDKETHLGSDEQSYTSYIESLDKIQHVEFIDINDLSTVYESIGKIGVLTQYIIVDDDLSQDFIFLDSSDIENNIKLNFQKPVSVLRRLLPLIAKTKLQFNDKKQIILLQSQKDLNRLGYISMLDIYLNNIVHQIPFSEISYEKIALDNYDHGLLSYFSYRGDSEADAIEAGFSEQSLQEPDTKEPGVKEPSAKDFGADEGNLPDHDVAPVTGQQVENTNVSDNEQANAGDHFAAHGLDSGKNLDQAIEEMFAEEAQIQQDELDHQELNSFFDVEQDTQAVDLSHYSDIDSLLRNEPSDVMLSESDNNDEAAKKMTAEEQDATVEEFKRQAILMAKHSLHDDLQGAKHDDSDAYLNTENLSAEDIERLEKFDLQSNLKNKPRVSPSQLKQFAELMKHKQRLENAHEQMPNSGLNIPQDTDISQELDVSQDNGLLDKAEEVLETQNAMENEQESVSDDAALNSDIEGKTNTDVDNEKEKDDTKTVNELTDIVDGSSGNKNSTYDDIVSQFKSMWNKK